MPASRSGIAAATETRRAIDESVMPEISNMVRNLEVGHRRGTSGRRRWRRTRSCGCHRRQQSSALVSRDILFACALALLALCCYRGEPIALVATAALSLSNVASRQQQTATKATTRNGILRTSSDQLALASAYLQQQQLLHPFRVPSSSFLTRKTAAPSSETLRMSVAPVVPNMFLGGSGIFYSSLKTLSSSSMATTTSGTTGRGTPTVLDRRSSERVRIGKLQYGGDRNRGVLGFRMDDHIHIDGNNNNNNNDKEGGSDIRKQPHRNGNGNNIQYARSSTSSELFSSPSSSSRRPSNVDSASWNLPDSWDYERKNRMFFMAGGAATTTQQQLQRGSATSPVPPNEPAPFDNALFSWFPWIPTRTQIDSLQDVSELRMACAERGLDQAGTEAELRDRLWNWTSEQQKLAATRQRQSSALFLQDDFINWGGDVAIEEGTRQGTKPGKQKKSNKNANESPERKSLSEWTETFDLKPLLNRREAIHREKNLGKTPKKKLDTTKMEPPSVDDLTRAFLREPSKSNNLQVKELYMTAKQADQRGDRSLAKDILLQLKETTPHDARIYRRLARMEKEEGNLSAARAVLQEGLRLHPNNAYLWHGMGQVASNDHDAKQCWRRAIQADPAFPNPYHALGTLEHTQGRIAIAMKTLKSGIEYCPTNHRLLHALGDLYREAKMLDIAEQTYRKALKHSPAVSRGFAVTALAYVAYEQGQVDKCRARLRKALKINARHANGWVALAQLEESEGNIDAARCVCIAGLAQYERGVFERSRNIKFRKERNDISLSEDPVALRNRFLKKVPVYRSGDRFFNLYRTWVRLEERYGTIEAVEEVYERATSAFPHEWKIFVDWAQYYAKLRLPDRARFIFSEACSKASNRHAAPYRHYAEFEMSLGNYGDARKILYQGAMAMTQSSDGAMGNRCGLAELFHTWAVCEWHLGKLSRAEVLFDNALRMTSPGEEGAMARSVVLYSIARLEHYQGEHLLAQHSIGLCLKENLMPGGNSKIWDLWADVATAMGNDKLARECLRQAEEARPHEDENGQVGLSRFLSSTPSSGLSRMKGRYMEGLMRRDPWCNKIFGPDGQTPDSFSGVKLPRTPQ